MASELGAEYKRLTSRRFDHPGGLSLAEAGEADLVRRLAEAGRLGSPQAALIVGPGDDAAVFRPPADRDLVTSQDALVEGKDFRREWITPFQLGARALNVALSDIAASGASPEYCLATLCAPRSALLDDVLAIQAGLCAAAAEFGCAVAGGDVSDIDGPLVIDVAVTGSVARGSHLSLSAGGTGDALVVSGSLGRAAAGLAILLGRDAAGVAADELDDWRAAQLSPSARIGEGLALVAAGCACATDISDGLVVSATALTEASGCGAEIWLDRLPVGSSLHSWPDWFDLAVAGGEDFELLAAVPQRLLQTLMAGWSPGLAPLTVIGRLHNAEGLRFLASEGGTQMITPRSRARHFG